MLRRAGASLGAALALDGGAAAAAARSLSAAAAAQPAHAQHSSGGEGDELGEFRDSVRQFAQELVAPHAAEIDRLNRYPDGG